MTDRTMWDSVTPTAIPTDAGIVAGYIDSVSYTWHPDGWARFPDAIKIRISTTGRLWEHADAFDCENGDLTPAQTAALLRKQVDAGIPWPTGYCNRSTYPALHAACRKAKLADHQWWRWIATLDGTRLTPDWCPNLAAVQAYGANTGHGNTDRSIVYADKWHPGGHHPPAAVHGVAVTSAGGLTHRRLRVPGNLGAVAVYGRQPLDVHNIVSHDGGRTYRKG